MPEEKNRTADDWLQFGKNAELNGELLIAVESYQKALKRFPSSFELHKAAGRLLASLQRFDDALRYLTVVHDRDTTDTEISYYLGISYEGVTQDRKAVDAYGEAMRLPNYRASAALRLAELHARHGQTQEAENFLKTALASDPLDLRTAEELVCYDAREQENRRALTSWRTSGSCAFRPAIFSAKTLASRACSI